METSTCLSLADWTLCGRVCAGRELTEEAPTVGCPCFPKYHCVTTISVLRCQDLAPPPGVKGSQCRRLGPVPPSFALVFGCVDVVVVLLFLGLRFGLLCLFVWLLLLLLSLIHI